LRVDIPGALLLVGSTGFDDSDDDAALHYDQEDEDDGGVTFANQLSLPRLPIPSLHESLNKFLDFLEPLQGEKEQELAQQVVLNFLKHDGPKLQDLLTRYEQEGIESGKLGSYVAGAYLQISNHSIGVVELIFLTDFLAFFYHKNFGMKVFWHPINR
jgi:hypothetical protein